jgi:hypothetical protein
MIGSGTPRHAKPDMKVVGGVSFIAHMQRARSKNADSAKPSTSIRRPIIMIVYAYAYAYVYANAV